MTDSVTIRTLLLDLSFTEGEEPDRELDNVRSAVAESLGMEVDLGERFVDFDIRQVYPGDIVSTDDNDDILAMHVEDALRQIRLMTSQARSALADENEGDFRAKVTEMSRLATSLRRLTELW